MYIYIYIHTHNFTNYAVQKDLNFRRHNLNVTPLTRCVYRSQGLFRSYVWRIKSQIPI